MTAREREALATSIRAFIRVLSVKPSAASRPAMRRSA
jgi:hypothetical protein